MRLVKEQVAIKYILHKQHLLEGSQVANVLQVVNDIVALHATSTSTPYLSLWVRMKKFQRSDLDREFYANRRLVRLEAMRGTLFITSTELASVLFQATRISDDRIAEWIQQQNITHSEYQKIVEYLHSILKGGGQTLTGIKSAMPGKLVRSVERRVGKTLYRMTNVNIVLIALMRQGLVVSEKFSEPVLTTGANRYRLFRDVYPHLNLEGLDSVEAKGQLIKRYIEAFGPVTESDITWWTGLTKSETTTVLTDMETELHQIQIKGLDHEYLMLEADYANFVQFKPPRKPSVLLLPYEDPYTKGYKDRNRLAEPEHENMVYVSGAVEPTILVNGKILGTWNRTIEKRSGPIKLRLFQRVKKGVKRVLIHKAKAIGKMMLNQEIKVEIEAVR